MARKNRDRLRRGLMAALGAVLLLSLGMLVFQAHQEKLSQEADLEAAELVKLPQLEELPGLSEGQEPSGDPTPGQTGEGPETGEPAPAESLPPPQEDPYAQALAEMDFRALQELNPDVMGWLVIPGTGISYPLLQGETNDTYLRHTWRKAYSTRGSIFLDCQCSRDLTDFNTIVYGHRMRNGTMFAPLANYGQESYRLAHPCVYIATESGTYRYEIFAVYETDTTSKAYQIQMETDRVRQGFVDYCLEQSFLNTGLKPTPRDRILTLSTCTPASNDERLVVQAVLWAEEEEPPEDNTPEEPMPEESAPGEITPEEPLPEETAPEETTPTETTPVVSVPAGNTIREPAPREPTPAVSAPEPSAPPESSPEEDLPEESTPLVSLPEEPAPQETLPAEEEILLPPEAQ